MTGSSALNDTGQEVRLARPEDQPDLEAFLLTHADTSLFLLSFLSRGGLVDQGQSIRAIYALAVRGGAIVGVAMHVRDGWLVLQAPEAAVEVARLAVETTQRAIMGIVGPWEQAERVRFGLGLSERGLQKHVCEDLFALDLSNLATPSELNPPGVRCRRAKNGDLSRLRGWRFHYEIESTGLPDSQETREVAVKGIEGHVERGEAFVLEADGNVVSMCTFNAQADDMVQIGGVWTPPALRGRGYGRMVVAGALEQGRGEGLNRAILFTEPENDPARRAYEALGFKRVGHYGMIVFTP